jgi:hypothetical protein
LADGVSALVLRVGESGVAPSEVDRLLEGVYLELAPVMVDAGADYVAAADAVLAGGRAGRGHARAVVHRPGRRPADRAAERTTRPSVDDAVATASRAAGYDGGVRAITIDGPAFHNLGACASWELAGSVAAGVAYLRLLGDGGLSIRDALRQSSFRFAADDDQFMIIATLRAARQLWARVAAVAGEPDGGAATVHAVTSVPMMAQRDPWVNMLRTTLATGFSRRISRNTQLLLEECHIGRVLDPVAGSWFVEDLTEQLAQQAWEHFQAIEERGGFVEARGFIAEQIEEVRAPAGGRRRAPAHGADRCQRIEPRGTTATARGFDVHPRALRGRFREAAGPLGCLPGKVRGAAAGAAASARPARRAQHPRDVRGEPARVGRDRGGQPRTVTAADVAGRFRPPVPPRSRSSAVPMPAAGPMPRASSSRPAVRGCRRSIGPARRRRWQMSTRTAAQTTT